MSWVEELGKVYDICSGEHDDVEAPLIVSHVLEDTQITISLNRDGTIPASGFAEETSEFDSGTIVPVTNESGARSGTGPQPRPLFDEIKYIAKDWADQLNSEQPDHSFFNAYILNLKKWAESEYCTDEVRAVYSYLSKGTVINDLIRCGMIKTDGSGKIPLKFKKDKSSGKDKFAGTEQDINGKSIEKCKVRFCVGGKMLWKDKQLRELFLKYIRKSGGKTQVCYATGTQQVPATKNPYVWNTSKLISSNDPGGFNSNYMGRFWTNEQCLSLGYDSSQKIHSSLKWLIKHNGKWYGNICVILWESALKRVPDVAASKDSLFGDDYTDEYDPGRGYVNQTVISLYGRHCIFSPGSHTMIMILESPAVKDKDFKGRLSMTMYEEMATSDYIDSVRRWHDSISWKANSKDEHDAFSFSVFDIANAAYGNETEEKKKKSGKSDKPKIVLQCKPNVEKDVIRRLIPCITTGRKVPRDLVSLLFTRACSPMSFDLKAGTWEKVLNCACGLIRKQIIEHKGECKMALDTECTSRDYLFGRLLAIADAAESSTYTQEDKDKRVTNAKRYFSAFVSRPCQTWSIIYQALIPYLGKMKADTADFVQNEINSIQSLMSREQFVEDTPLSPEFLHAYSCEYNNSAWMIKKFNNKSKNVEDK